MKAVIMAGGKGTRLSSVLKDIPKPMVDFAGKPLLEHQIDNLKNCGICDVILVIGHLGSVIKNYFRDGKKFGVNISYYEEINPLGTAGALAFLKDELKEDFILLFGDLYINIDFNRFIQFHKNNEAWVTLYTHPNSHPNDSDIVVTNQKSEVVGWSYKNTKRNEYYKNQVNAGIYVLSPKVLDNIESNKKTDLEKQVICNLIPNCCVYAYQCTEYVKDIGTPERLQKVLKDYENGICERRNLKNKQKCIFLDRDGTINKYVGFLKSAEEFELEDRVADAIRMINESEYLVIVISNQPVIARGECTFEELDRIHNKMYMLLGEKGAYIDDLYYCPHHPDNGFDGEVRELKIKCDCRKPGIGMITKATIEHNIDISNSWIIGDTMVDIQTGINAGIRTVLVQTGEAGKDCKYDVLPDINAGDMCDAVEKIFV